MTSSSKHLSIFFHLKDEIRLVQKRKQIMCKTLMIAK